MEPKRYRES